MGDPFTEFALLPVSFGRIGTRALANSSLIFARSWTVFAELFLSRSVRSRKFAVELERSTLVFDIGLAILYLDLNGTSTVRNVVVFLQMLEYVFPCLKEEGSRLAAFVVSLDP